jgi:hypothetical protein
MEGAGLYVASHHHKVDWIVIKAICDWADGEKGKNKSGRQKKAAQNAAQFLMHALQQVPLSARRSSTSGLTVSKIRFQGYGYSPTSPSIRDLPLRIQFLAHNTIGVGEPQVVMILGEERDPYDAKRESAVWLSERDASRLRKWLSNFSAAAKIKAEDEGRRA